MRKLFLELVLDRISSAVSESRIHNQSTCSNSTVKVKGIERGIESLFPGVLVLLKEICNGEVTPWVKKICTYIGVSLVEQVHPIENWTAPPGAWFLLSEVSGYLSKAVNWEFLHCYCRTCAAARRSSTLKEKSEYVFLANKERQGILVSIYEKKWTGSRHLVFWLLGTLTGL
ncbi:hypothetical protein NC653_022126 [Populus alba x Populus x berolinensis]|uniref:Uncharacterized protein n=1 Tax=Populus alba x Populus x berolinensis TaxID=444605 RepID=A0AAD6QFJ5_9ROSI|nr:hypothetical protein NC653_022126 [Populus alba x Populus x berolinensis]